MTSLPMTKSLAAAALATALTWACNTSTEGAGGNVEFTPSNCGRVSGCDLAAGLGVGGRAHIQISGIDGFSTAGLDLVSEAPELLAVTRIGDVNNRPTWELEGLGEGVAQLSAVSGSDSQDFVDLDVVSPAALTMLRFGGNAVGPEADAIYDQRWTVNSGEQVVLLVTPLGPDEQPLMGRYTYVPVIDSAEFDSFINNPEILNDGTLDFIAELPGEYSLSFNDSARQTSIAILIEVVASQ